MYLSLLSYCIIFHKIGPKLLLNIYNNIQVYNPYPVVEQRNSKKIAAEIKPVWVGGQDKLTRQI